MTTVNEVVDFWLDEVGADRLYAADEELDHEVRRRFEQLWWDMPTNPSVSDCFANCREL